MMYDKLSKKNKLLFDSVIGMNRTDGK